MTIRYLFDSFALLALFQKEQGAKLVAGILNRALSQNLDRLICVINVGEIVYLTRRRFGNERSLKCWLESINWASRYCRYLIRSYFKLRRSKLNTRCLMPTALPWHVPSTSLPSL
jgi:hypothetical protein